MSDAEFQGRVRDLNQALNERAPANWRCLVIVSETDSKRQSVVSNIEPTNLLKVLKVVVAGIEKALGGGK